MIQVRGQKLLDYSDHSVAGPELKNPLAEASDLEMSPSLCLRKQRRSKSRKQRRQLSFRAATIYIYLISRADPRTCHSRPDLL